MKESAVSIVYRTVAELPAGATFTSVSLSRDLEGMAPSLVSASFGPLKDDDLIHEIGVGPRRTITYQRTAMPGRERKFKGGLRDHRTTNRSPGYAIPNAGRPDLPRIAGEPAPRPDLEGRPITLENLSDPSDEKDLRDVFPNMDRSDVTSALKNRPLPPEQDFVLPDPPRSTFLPLSARLRDIADAIEEIERLVGELEGKVEP